MEVYKKIFGGCEAKRLFGAYGIILIVQWT